MWISREHAGSTNISQIKEKFHDPFETYAASTVRGCAKFETFQIWCDTSRVYAVRQNTLQKQRINMH
jgi:hypothetical protein